MTEHRAAYYIAGEAASVEMNLDRSLSVANLDRSLNVANLDRSLHFKV